MQDALQVRMTATWGHYFFDFKTNNMYTTIKVGKVSATGGAAIIVAISVGIAIIVVANHYNSCNC